MTDKGQGVEMGGNRRHGPPRSASLSWLTLLAVLAAATIVPYLLFGEQLEDSARAWLEGAASRPGLAAALVVVLLCSDVVLPVPSSIVGVFAGATLGVVYGAAAIWSGLMLGCVAGYWLGRLMPARFVGVAGKKGSAPTPMLGRAGLLMLAATRAIPVLAETGIVAAGAARMGFGPVVLVTALANLFVALAYAAAGALLATLDPVLVAILATVALAMAWGLWLLAGRSGPAIPTAHDRAPEP